LTCACKRGTGWLRLVGSLKLHVSFAKEPYKRGDIRQWIHLTCACKRGTGWLRLVGSLKLHVSFAKEPIKRGDIRQWIHLTCAWNRGTGGRRLIGCLQLQVNFRKRAANYRALLREMTYEDKASYDYTPPCTSQPIAIGVSFLQCQNSIEY